MITSPTDKACDDVPDGYWEAMAALLEKLPRLPDDDMTDDPPCLI